MTVAASGSKAIQNVIICRTVGSRVLLDSVYSDSMLAIKFLDESGFSFVERWHGGQDRLSIWFVSSAHKKGTVDF